MIHFVRQFQIVLPALLLAMLGQFFLVNNVAAKPGAPVAIDYVIGETEAGLIPVTLTLKSSINSGSMQVQLSPDSGLQLASEASYQFDLGETASPSFTFTVQRITTDRQYVHITVTVDQAEGAKSRSIAIRIP